MLVCPTVAFRFRLIVLLPAVDGQGSIVNLIPVSKGYWHPLVHLG